MLKKFNLFSITVIFYFLFAIANLYATDKQITLLVASWCVRCKEMEELLIEQKVVYQKLDVEKDTKGRQLYGSLGGGGVPILISGNKLIRGYDRLKVLEMLTTDRKIK